MTTKGDLVIKERYKYNINKALVNSYGNAAFPGLIVGVPCEHGTKRED